MSYPSQSALKVPLLRLIEEFGGQIHLSSNGDEIRRTLADLFNLSSEDRNRKGPPNTKDNSKWLNHIQQVRRHLIDENLLEMPYRGIWKITDKGKEHTKRFMGDGSVRENANAQRQIREKSEREQQLIDDGTHFRSPKTNEVVELISEDEESRCKEGEVKYRLHREHERDTKLAQTAKQLRIQKCGELRCDVCDFCFADVYGAWAEGFIEAHHNVPISQLKESTVTKIADLSLVCANCHRMLHYKRPWLSVERLRKVVLESRRYSKSLSA
jgi:hypothetical protein